MSETKSKLIKETFWSFLTKGITFVLLFGLNLFLARSLGVEKFGYWSYFFSILSIVLLLSYFGINISSKKYIAEHNGTNKLRSVIRSSLRLRFLFSLAFAIIILLMSKPLSIFLKDESFFILLIISSPLVFLMGFVEYFKEAFTGLHKLKGNFIINLCEYGGKLLLVTLFFYLFSKNIFSIISAFSISVGITVIVGLYLLFRETKTQEVEKVNFTKELLKYSLPLFVVSIGFAIATEVDTLMIGLISGKYEVGIYAVAKQITLYLPQISLAIAMGTMPIFAKLNNENKTNLKKIFYKLIKLNTLIFGIISILLLSLSWFFVPLIFGQDYVSSVIPLMCLIPYIIIFSYSIFFSSFLDYVGLAKKRAINLVFSIILNIGLNLLFIPIFGASGAAIATSVAYVPYLILNWIEVRKVLN